jgi:hypothetical protein
MLSSPSNRLRLTSRLILFFIAAYGLIWVSGFPRKYDDEELPSSAQNQISSQPDAPHRVEPDQLVLTVKTTAVDTFVDVPQVLVLQDSRFYDTLNLMSDMHMDIGGFHVHDVLDRLDAKFVESHPDLARYGRQMQLVQQRINLEKLREEDPQKEREARKKVEKYKYLRMIERAWELKPDRLWYVFADTDTFLFRSNVLVYLGQFDPTKNFFFANSPGMDATETHEVGSSTFILSVQAMRSLLVDRRDVISKWDSRVAEHGSGFDVLTSALSTELGLGFNQTWPGISGFHPANVPYGPGMWCERVLAMHHVPPQIASGLWRFQRDREEYQHINDPLAFADLWGAFVQPENMGLPRDDWDNLSSSKDNARWNILFESVQPNSQNSVNRRDEEGRAANGEDSFESCRESCDKNVHCVQYSYSSVPMPNYNENGATKCHLSRGMRLGVHAAPEEKQFEDGKKTVTWRSGWRRDKFDKWTQQQRCKGQQDKN